MEKVENIERASVPEQAKKKSIVREYAEAIIIALVLAFIIRTFVVQAFKFPKDESRDFIKRVVGLPGDKIEVKDKKVYINDKEIDESYAFHEEAGGGSFYPGEYFCSVTVPENNFFVMGDNRENSMDSRFWGLLDKNKIKGRAFIIYWSWDSMNFGVRWNRLAMMLK